MDNAGEPRAQKNGALDAQKSIAPSEQATPAPSAPEAAMSKATTSKAATPRALRVLQVCLLVLLILVTLVAFVGIIVDRFFLGGSLSFFVVNALITNPIGQFALKIGTTVFLPLLTSPEIWLELLGLLLPFVLIVVGVIAMRRLKRAGRIGAVVRPFICLCLSLIMALFTLTIAYTDYVWYVARYFVLSSESISTTNFSQIQTMMQEEKFFAQMVIDTVCLELQDPALSIDDLDESEYLEAAQMVALSFQIKGTVNSSEEHYLRNYFYRAPQTLDDMLKEIRAGSPFAWILLAQDQTVYHMQGPDGAYNLKFVSEDGYHEAIYNKDGVLLTEKNDPVNMGTFNYASPLSAPAMHAALDVLPYYSYGNSPASPTSSPENYDYKNIPDAQKRWQELHDLLSSYAR